uniref:Uncharacterized protein n=1 Tax=Populus alba TaxID=43335 RepID=A0A4U5NPM9_POPAL|nr:hypothetical protein D5086_0000252650 [Populus alba]
MAWSEGLDMSKAARNLIRRVAETAHRYSQENQMSDGKGVLCLSTPVMYIEKEVPVQTVFAKALTLNSKANTLTPLTLKLSMNHRHRSTFPLLSLGESHTAKVFKAGGFGDILNGQVVDKKHLIDDVRQALNASKICSYA